MRRPALLIYAYVICMFPSHVSGDTCPSPHGIKCVEDCQLSESGYNCQAMTEEGKRLTLHCSPESSLDDSQEHEHTSLYCDIDDEYHWCQVDGDKPLYLHHYTYTYGEVCDDTCGKNGNNYFWCSTKKGWDYCSAAENVDYQGYAGREEHGEAKTLHPNRLNVSRAENTEILSWTDHASYWRNIVGGVLKLIVHWPLSWLIQESTSQCFGKRLLSKRQADDGEIIDTITDKGNCVETRFIAHVDLRTIADGSFWRSEITNIIALWDNSVLRNQPKSGLISSGDLRIDLQGLVNRGNQRYYNLQIQLNVHRNNGESTTVAQILIPEEPEIPTRYVRRAFLESFRRRAKVTVEVKHVNQCKRQKKKKAKG
ncbi:uncharacterized protein [Salminus brasiliensis]|uniref:uncharacterized protein n=1 Tax=Salminus brasiliensis TaxID=930266 RepID=UPI003B83891A